MSRVLGLTGVLGMEISSGLRFLGMGFGFRA